MFRSSPGQRHPGVRSALVLASVLGGALSVLSVACADDPSSSGDVAPPDVDAGAGGDASPDAAVTPDAGADRDARGPYDPADVPVACGASPCATQIVAGGAHFCARMNDGTVRCWGDDAFGALGTIPEPDWGKDDPKGGGKGPPPEEPGEVRSTVHVIADLAGVAQLSAAGATTCALLGDGSVACWGDNRDAQLGLDRDPPVADWDPHPTPSIVPLDGPATRVDVGHGVACARLASGALWCWGNDTQGKLARPGAPELDPWNPVRGPGAATVGPLGFSRIAASQHTVLGVTSDGAVWTWGALAGELGTISGRIGLTSPSATPKRVDGLSGVTSLVASAWIEPPYDPPPGKVPPRPPPRAHACALANGEVYCWGRSYAGALCTGFPDVEHEPAHAPFPASVAGWPQQLAAGDEITCARMTDGSVYCCGSDARGRLGTGGVGNVSPSFTKAAAFARHAVQVAASDRAVCAVVVDGTVECWGSNEKGELGRTPDWADHPSPVKVEL